MQKEIDTSTQRGHCVQAAWATPERMTVLLAKPMDAACDRPHEYEVEESDRFDGRRGFRPVDVTWRETGSRGMRAIDIIMSRPHQ